MSLLEQKKENRRKLKLNKKNKRKFLIKVNQMLKKLQK